MVYRLCLFSILALFLIQCEQKPYAHGEILYTNFCVSCHMEDGSGLAGLIPPLAKADYLANNPSLLPCIIRHGLEGEIVVNGKTYNQPMAGIKKLTDAEIANIINYINTSWGNEYPVMPLGEVRRVLEECE